MNELEQKAYIFASIFALSNKLQVLGDQFDPNITVKQWLFMLGVSKISQPPTVSEVANLVGYSRQNAKRIAATLKLKGYVTITRDKNDARALRIALTPKCTAYFASRNDRELAFLDQLFTGFDTGLINGFFQGVSKLTENIEIMLKDNTSI